MRRIDTPLQGVYLIEPRVWEDERGFFFESYNHADLEKIGISAEFVQDNISFSHKGVLRGMHYQLLKPQAKLVRCLQGSIFDVVIDVRRGSPTFGQWFGCELSEENNQQLFVPTGFAHGFYTLSNQARVFYKCSDYYFPPGERSIIWNDPEVAINWPLKKTEPIMSSKDLAAMPLSNIEPNDLPVYEG